ncbi:MAG: AEC family transporter [Desulfuromonadaceae bacterium]|nr:AEC family transporter [Desulfuromonadaceae bacterium]
MLFINIIVPVFVIVFCGFLLERYGRIELEPLTTSSLYLFAPALTLSALLRHPLQSQLLGDVLFYMLAYLVIMLVLSASVGRLLGCDGDSRRALSLSSSMMNIGNFGLPLTWFAFGEAGVPIAIVVFVIFSLPLGSLAIIIAQGEGANWRTAIVNSLKIPIFHAAALAMLLQAFSIQLPPMVLRPLELMGQAAVPLMLVLLGMQISRTRWQWLGGFMLAGIGLRLIAGPAVGWGLCQLLHIRGLERDVLLLQTSTPAAVLPLLYALRFNTRPDLVASTIVTTTLCSAGSLTLLLYLLPKLP